MVKHARDVYDLFRPQSLNCAQGKIVILRAAEQRSEEHTSELQSLRHLVCRLLLEKKKRPDSDSALLDRKTEPRIVGLVRGITSLRDGRYVVNVLPKPGLEEPLIFATYH